VFVVDQLDIFEKNDENMNSSVCL